MTKQNHRPSISSRSLERETPSYRSAKSFEEIEPRFTSNMHSMDWVAVKSIVKAQEAETRKAES